MLQSTRNLIVAFLPDVPDIESRKLLVVDGHKPQVFADDSLLNSPIRLIFRLTLENVHQVRLGRDSQRNNDESAILPGEVEGGNIN